MCAASGDVDEEDIGRGAAHVETDDAFEARQTRYVAGADDASGWAGQHGARGFLRGEAGRNDASRGLHHVHAAAGVLRGHALLQM